MDLSFVFPCLNEERTLAICIEKVKASLDGAGICYEIIVADNGSTDSSREIADHQGTRLVPVATKGYGAALRGGIAAATGKYVMFADADNTYQIEDTRSLYEAAVEIDADMAIASRMTGTIEPGAMPPLHRHLGTPVLTSLINILFQGKLSDCNSGFRCLKKTSYEAWNIRSTGMEFASELLIKALKAGAKTTEIRSGLRRGPEGRVAHLSTWRDGMRHLLFILSERPQLFEVVGLTVVVLTTFLQILATVLGPMQLLGLNVFDLHTKALLLLGAITGIQLYLFGCFLYLRSEERPLRITRKLINLDEGTLFFLLLALVAGECSAVGVIIVQWWLSDFGGLELMNVLLPMIHALAVPGLLTIALLGIHVFKKSDGR